MNIKSIIFVWLTSLALASAAPDGTAPEPINSTGGDYYIGQSSFPFGDFIEITSIEYADGQLVVRGRYQLASAEYALLALYTTTKTATSTPDDPKQTMHISRGRGDFELVHPNLVPGLNHVTMYSDSGNKSSSSISKPFAGVYFGTKEEAAEESHLDLGYYRDATATASPAPEETLPHNSNAPMPAANQALIEYLGEPVPAPSNLDERYSVDGLRNAIRQAEQKAGIKVKRVTIDDSEFPFIIAVICGGSDVIKLKSELKKITGYGYGGGIGNDTNSDGSDTCNVFNLTPHTAYPSDGSQQIYRRLWLREQVFFDKVNQTSR